MPLSVEQFLLLLMLLLYLFLGSITLNEIGLMFDKDILAQLKSECGGIQTVLKNCADVFFGIFLCFQLILSKLCATVKTQHSRVAVG